ncbi:LPS O-antigen chain length determinant protein WzzB [Pseudomonas fluorescens]|uniref:Wzz/FepE/Etk N-terminal domain-containing protein n=1 Tax=Pseudomonas fluorescens TaxID=294 RepID=UPI0019035197|nr:Wzz/FepE/Etk N-terminal domain-containing protein [Pseudomonas fluorescens]MBD8095290.1 LPS O-antigen chain length determinant protein WzzB [Pseudomonas fluorescens]MBD8721248.1 LPS O-antigen chain length determinant protein WzzB [Pseudomonas fluorescens]
MNQISPINSSVTSDEIDLFELFHAIWRQKILIVGCTLLAGVLGAGYAMVTPKQYEVSSVLRPAAINELDALNRSEVYKLPPSEALVKVGAQLDSYGARLAFFKSHEELFKAYLRPGLSVEQSFENFNRSAISLSVPDSKAAESPNSAIRLELQYPSDVDGVAILNGLVDYAIAAQREQVGADLKVIVNNRLTELKGKIDAARANYDTEKESKIAVLLEADRLKRARLQDELKGLRLQMKIERTDRLAELAEAISIAKSMGINQPTTPSSMADTNRAGSSQVVRTEISNQKIPLYFLGTEALEAERNALQKRTSDDFTSGRIAEIGKELQLLDTNREVEILQKRGNEDIFLRDVEPLRTEIARLRSLNIDMSNLELVSVDRRAQEPLGPIKPRKLMILVLSLVAGAFVGVLIALIRHLILSYRQSRSPAGPSSGRQRTDDSPVL